MKMNQNCKRVNGLFLSIILLYLGIVAFFSFLTIQGVSPGIITRLMTSELLVLVPGVTYILCSKRKLTELMPVKKLKISTCLIMVLYTACLMPIASFVNAISLLFTENIMLSESEIFLAYPLPVMLLIVGAFGPFCEEFIFRGVIFGAYRNTGMTWGAIVLSSLLFGLMHMNINQFCYAFVLGIAFALVVEATGSIWSGFIAHLLINSNSMVMMHVSDWMTEATGGLANAYVDMDISEMLYPMIGVLLIIATFAVAIGACILVWMAKNEGRLERLQEIFSKQQFRVKGLISWQIVVAILICIAVIVSSMILSY